MAYDSIDRIIELNFSFLEHTTIYDREHLIERIRNHPNREEISKCLIKAKYYPSIIFNVIYDDPKFIRKTLALLKKYKWLEITDDMFERFINSSQGSLKYVLNNLDEMLKLGLQKRIAELAECLIKNRNYQFLSYHLNMKYRAAFMLHLINNHYELFAQIYPDPIRYLYQYNYSYGEQLSLMPELMDEDDLSDIICAILKKHGNTSLFYQLKEFLLANYKGASLGSKLAFANTEEAQDEFKCDADRLFLSSNVYELQILNKYNEYITEEIKKDFMQTFKFFLGKNGTMASTTVANIFSVGLGRELKRCVNTYLDLSVDKTCGKIKAGSTAEAYKIGDFVVKLVYTKYSTEPIICPDLYLIVHNFEEIFIRNSSGKVIGGLEVQKYLRKSAKDVDESIFHLYRTSLSDLGYYIKDTLINGSCGDNTRVLNSYLDADTKKPEELPDWFKETPLVLVDRDLVYKIKPKNNF